MPEHRIYLRKAWETWTISDPEAKTTRIELPFVDEVPAGLRWFSRRFQWPASGSKEECVCIILENVPGLLSIRFNQDILWQGHADEAFRFERICPDWEPGRCELLIESETGGKPGWGQAYLAIRSRPDFSEPSPNTSG